MKKKLLGLFLVFALLLGIGLTIGVKAEGEEPTYTSSVVINVVEHGEITVDKKEGNVGDIVTITTAPSVLYVLDSVYANGTQLLTNEDGLYQFVLVEGENTVGAKFVLNNEALETIVEMMKTGKEKGFDTLFTPENLITLIGAIISLFCGTSLLLVVSKLKKTKETVTKEVTAANQGAYNETLTNIQKTMVDTKEAINVLARCTVLQQEGTPEARLAIIDEITKLQSTNDNLADEVKDVINEGLEKMKELQNSKIKAIQELEEANNNLITKNDENEPKNSNVGRY